MRWILLSLDVIHYTLHIWRLLLITRMIMTVRYRDCIVYIILSQTTSLSAQGTKYPMYRFRAAAEWFGMLIRQDWSIYTKNWRVWFCEHITKTIPPQMGNLLEWANILHERIVLHDEEMLCRIVPKIQEFLPFRFFHQSNEIVSFHIFDHLRKSCIS